MQDATQVSYHEATLVGVSRRGNAVALELEDAFIAGARGPASVTVEGVQGILRDGVPAKDIRMEEQDGEVLSLREEGQKTILVVQWNDFAAKRRSTVAYDLLEGRIRLDPGRAGPD